MKRRKWQRIIAFAASAAMVLSTSGMQTLVNEIGDAVHAEEIMEEVVLDEETSDVVLSDEDTNLISDSEERQEVDVLSADSEDSVLFIEDIEVSSSGEAELATGGSASENTSNIEETPLMEVETVLLAEESEKESGSNRKAQGAIHWVTVKAADLADDSEGEAIVRIYLTDQAAKEPAEDVEVLLFDERPDELPENPKELPLNIEDALNGDEDLYVERVQEYEEDENGEYKKDDEGNYIVEKDYLQFTLPAGGEAEFEAAFLYETAEKEYEYSVLASAKAVQSADGQSSSVLFDDYDEDDKDRDNELTVTWTSQAKTESESESETEAENETEVQSESETESEITAEAESETEVQSESETEAETETGVQSESETETESAAEAESEAETEAQSENETEAASETETEVESENETEVESETESESAAKTDADALGDVPVSSVRVTMTKELESAAETNAADTAVSGQTYIVHVQAEDLQPDAQYDSIVSIHLTDYATGLPAEDVITTVCKAKEEIQSADPAAVTTLSGAVQTPDGTEDLEVTRIQATKTAEDGTVTVADDYLKFSLPAGSSADFYIGFTYATAEAAYEKQLMVEVEAVQYIPTTPNDNFSDIFSSTAEGQETEESTDQNAEYPAADQGLLPEATLEGNDDLSVKTQSADDEIIIAEDAGENAAAENSEGEISADGAAAEDNSENFIIEETVTADEASTVLGASEDVSDEELELATAVTVEADEQEDGTDVVAVDVLESESDSVVMLWATSSATKTIYFDTCGNGDWNNWTKGCTMYIYVFGDGWHQMQKSSRQNTLTSHSSCGGTLWEYTVASTCTGVIFGNTNSFDDNTRVTADVTLNAAVAPVYKLSGWYVTAAGNTQYRKTVSYLGDLGTLSQAGNPIYFRDLSGTLAADATIVATFTGDGITVTTAPVSADANGFYTFTIPSDSNNIAYSTVQFKDAEGNELSTIYNFLEESASNGFAYNKDTLNTYYYRATEYIDGTFESAWSAKVSAAASLTGKTVYFDKRFFSTSSAAQFQIGTDDTLNTLAAVSGDTKTYSYTFASNAAATQQTILTYIDSKGTQYHFLWNDISKNEVILSDGLAVVGDTYVSAPYTIYFDATLSKLSYAGTTTDASIPMEGKSIYFHAWNSISDTQDGKMELLDSYKKGANVWNDVYSANLNKKYNYIVFYSSDAQGTWPAENSSARTKDQNLNELKVWDLENPCFYADTSDDAIYTPSARSGDWEELYTVTDPETKETKNVVDIGSAAFTQDSSILYVDSTFYDYYTDYELNGKNRDDYGGANGSSHRNWVNFRQFNQALSEYYEGCGADIPIYTGHFQPSEYGDKSWPFSAVASTLNLFGFSNYKNFISTNNSGYDISGNADKYDYAAQGLVNSTLSNGLPTVKNGSAVLPHFNQAFLEGQNSKNTKIGKVYQNVSFPFTKKDVKNNGVEYWYFDSADTTLAMKEDTNGNGYYLKDVGHQGWSKNVNSRGTQDSGVGTGQDKVSTDYGFFPFNETASSASGKNYNYGFGTKLEFTFRLTSDGKVQDKNGKKIPIIFEFSGDDDVWVFIDGKLALDIGGAHGRVTGTIDFSGESTTKTATVSKVKASAGSSTPGTSVKSNFTLDGSNESEHTLTMFYMERGMWESNMKLMFNFPDENQLQVEKEVDTTDVNDLFESIFTTNTLFTYSIQNLATHYESEDTDVDVVDPVTVNLKTNNLTKPSAATFRLYDANKDYKSVTDQNNANGVAYWLGASNDVSATNRSNRSGTITLPEAISSKNYKYLEFKFWYNWSDYPGLQYMYLELYNGNTQLTTKPVSNYLVSASTIKNNVWVTVKLDLDLMLGSGHDKTITALKFSYNYARNVYLKDFVFSPSTEVDAGLVGFIVQQEEIADYGSASSGQLEPAVNAIYSTNSKVRANYRVDSNGNFTLHDGEIATFNDQFRRGSYIALKEELTDAEKELYDTTWTMYENGKAVTSLGKGSKVTVSDTAKDMTDVGTVAVDDGRTEQKGDTTAQTNNNYDGKKPDTETFVFRSYSNPDNENATTKLKVVYRNKVNVGSLTLRKEQAVESNDLDQNTVYTFKIEFTNVGGSYMEGGTPVTTTVKLKKGEEKTISGIPLNTHYKITEIVDDGSTLDSVEKEGTAVDFDKENRTVEGDITSSESTCSYIFKNAIKPVVSVELTKAWQNSDGSTLNSDDIPGVIWVQLQRKASNADAWEVVPGYKEVEVSLPSDKDWSNYIYTFSSLDQYVSLKPAEADRVEYSYRVMELQWDDTQEQYVAIENGGTFDKVYKVTYGDVSLKSSTGTGEVDPVYTQTIINRLKPTVTNLKITKVDSTNNSTKLSGVTFTLDKVVEAENGSIAIGEKSYNTVSADEFTQKSSVTGSEGIAVFENLSDGIYILQESETLSTYNLLTDKILVVISREGTCSITGSNALVSPNGGGTVTIDETENAISCTIANVQRTKLQITKKAAGGDTLLNGVEFKLEKKKSSGEGYDLIDTKVTENGLVSFENLEDGSYLLTETKAASGYSLLKSPIEIVITRAGDGKYTVDGETETIQNGVINLTVYNQSKFSIPATGSWSNYIITFAGAIIAGAALIMYLLSKRRKEGRAS